MSRPLYEPSLGWMAIGSSLSLLVGLIMLIWTLAWLGFSDNAIAAVGTLACLVGVGLFITALVIGPRLPYRDPERWTSIFDHELHCADTPPRWWYVRLNDELIVQVWSQHRPRVNQKAWVPKAPFGPARLHWVDEVLADDPSPAARYIAKLGA